MHTTQVVRRGWVTKEPYREAFPSDASERERENLVNRGIERGGARDPEQALEIFHPADPLSVRLVAVRTAFTSLIDPAFRKRWGKETFRAAAASRVLEPRVQRRCLAW